MYSAPSLKFTNQALQHNARRAGADFIVIEKISSNPTREFVPKHTVDITETRKPPTAEDWTNYHKKVKDWDGRNSSFPEWPTAGPVKVGTKEVPDYTKTLFENTTVEAIFLQRK